MRLFIAVQFSDEILNALVGTMHDLKQQGLGGKYTPKQNLHLTLAFLGETKQAREIREAMAAVPFEPFHLSLDGSGNFGNLIWAGVKGSQKLKGYVRDLRRQLKAAGIPFDEKDFVPHVTLVRDAASAKSYRVSVPKKDMMVRRISLMKSENKNGRMVYTEIAHTP